VHLRELHQFATASEIVLTSTNSHKFCEVSPCGRALATYACGRGPAAVWHSPFAKLKRSVVGRNEDVVDFQSAAAETLTAVTANTHGVVRLWAEGRTAHGLRCLRWFHLAHRVLSVSFACAADPEMAIEKVHRSHSKHGIFPIVSRPPALLLVTLAKETENLCVLQEVAGPQMVCLARITVHLEAAIATLAMSSPSSSRRASSASSQ
jgi:hypothetical protein